MSRTFDEPYLHVPFDLDRVHPTNLTISCGLLQVSDTLLCEVCEAYLKDRAEVV